jgi:hypothetical protein
VLSEPDRDPKRLFKETPELIGIVNFKVADSIINACNWANRFRAFYPERFDQSRLGLLRAFPEWWDHLSLDIALFEHVAHFGFSRPSTMLSRPPFSDLLPGKNRDAVSRAAVKERETGKRVKCSLPSNLSFLLSKKELRNHIDAIIHDLAVDDIPEIRVNLDRKSLRSVALPRIFNEALIEALGTGEFGVVNGYLYRIGFKSRVRYCSNEYSCRIVENSLAPFEIVSNTGSKSSGATPSEAFEGCLGGHFDGDAYELFGIGVPVVRYWLQEALGDRRVVDYRTIKFEIRG